MEQGEDMSSLSGIGIDEVEQEEDGGCSCNGFSCMMHGGCWEEMKGAGGARAGQQEQQANE